MKTAAIAGASGLVGSHLLALLLEQQDYGKVIALVRKPLPVAHPKLEQQVVDFNDPETLKTGADDVFSCLGTTIAKAGSQEKFREIDHDYPLNLAKAAMAGGATGFYIVSAAGADSHSSIFYSRVKGELDNTLSGMGFARLGIFRPSMLLGDRQEFRLGEKIGKMLMQGLAFMIPAKWKAVHAATVARAMLKFALGEEQGTRIIDNADIRKTGS